MENYEKAEQDYMAGMKYKEIAEKYDTTINTVKSWKKRYGWNRGEGAHKKQRVHPRKQCLLMMAQRRRYRTVTLRRNSRCFASITARHSMRRRVTRKHMDASMRQQWLMAACY